MVKRKSGFDSTAKWGRVSIRKELVEAIGRFLKTREGRELGYTNVTQFVDSVLREEIKSNQARFEVLDILEDKIPIIDNTLGKNGNIVNIFYKNDSGFCDYCDHTNCIHVKYCWSVPYLSKILKNRGLRPLI